MKKAVKPSHGPLPTSDRKIVWEDFPEAGRSEFCKAFLECAAKAFENPDVVARYEDWKKAKEKAPRPAKTGSAHLHGGDFIIILPKKEGV